ncbi:dinuclear metal center protein, YbgI/SA1388 family [Acetitomaculum ruminis DSM 5522]|uniref:GTP cyclohydrolase 1 type 2 homolog n=1 Tax=Acetitomaculum ruminis DSM 5522 TaxID=1120918 RepID=A0A1I0VTP2_9FIRM|nr:Nif3-like dinuclear metal center hexameric protein [Acetitomaculum ruminis]SFA79704.1 dinuclear metal center protein, YbgI/SA1388 family [Acetitomaculum ruminis DSM 5522]
MKCYNVIEFMRKIAPERYAFDWDNPGLQCGRRDKDVERVFVAVDATERVIKEAKNCQADMLITHHPLIFKGINNVNSTNFIGRRLLNLIGSDISYYAMHTNFDITVMGEYAADYLRLSHRDVLEVTLEENGIEKGIGVCGRLPFDMTLRDCGEYVKNCFGLDSVKIFGDLSRHISYAAVSPGSGKGMSDVAVKKGVEVLITGDIDHHEGIDAVAKDLCIIDAGHYGIEYIFVSYITEYLRKNTDLEVHGEEFVNPFNII